MGGFSRSLSISCPDCAFQMPDVAAFCPGCGRSMEVAAHADGMVGAFSENVAGALAYFTFIPAAIFLLRLPYKANHFVRFHSVQCLLYCMAALIVGAALRLLALVLYVLPIAGYWLMVVASVVAGLAGFVTWLVLVVKALQGESFRLPLLGELAAQQAGDVRSTSD
jgi:uncharacterized membrane protein